MKVKSFLLVVIVMLPMVLCDYSLNSTSSGNCPNLKNSVGTVRKRRHLAFIPGSAVSMLQSTDDCNGGAAVVYVTTVYEILVRYLDPTKCYWVFRKVAVSAVKTFMTHVPAGWYFVVEAEMVYMLPDAKFVAAQKRRKLHHRQKREMWELLQTALDERNMNGRECILRTVCETQIMLAPKGKSLVHDILRSIFTDYHMTSATQNENNIQELEIQYKRKEKKDEEEERAPVHEEEFVKEIGVSFNELLESDYCEKPNDCPFSFLSFILDLNKER